MLENAKQLQIEKDMKEKEAKKLALEKAQIEALIEKYRPHTQKTPDEVNTLGTGKNANIDGQKGIEKEKLPHKRLQTSQNKGDKANKGNPDTLLGDPKVNTKICTYKAKEIGQKDTIGINNIGIFEFIFQGLPNAPASAGMDEDRLREYKMLYKSNYTKEMKKEKEILLKEFKSLRKHLIL